MAGRTKLYGWDLVDIVKGTKIVERRELSVKECWVEIGTEILVLRCKDLGEIIQPDSSPYLTTYP